MNSICNTIRGQASGIFLAAVLVLAAGLSVPVSGSAQTVTGIDAATDGTSAEQDLLALANQATEALIAGRLDDALRLFNEVIGSNAMAPRVLAASHYHRGIIHQKRGRYNDAAADYTTALWLEELPDNMRARAHYNRGTALDNLGQQEKAKQDFDIAISLAPDMAAAYNNRANVLRRMGDYQAAIADYEKSIALGNRLPHLPHYGRAMTLEAMGDIEGARADLRAAMTLAPDYAPAASALAALPEPPSALAVAAAPEAVSPPTGKASSIALDEIAAGPGIAVEPVVTAMLPPPPAAEAAPVAEVSIPVPTPQPRMIAPSASEAAAYRTPAVPPVVAPTAVASSIAGAGTRRSLADLPAAHTQMVPQQYESDEAVRITTASAANFDTPDPAPAHGAPKPMQGSWTTTILPAGSRDVLTLDDATPSSALAISALALRGNQPTQVASMQAPAPKAGMSFAGVPADSFREPPAKVPVRTSAASPAPAAARPTAQAVMSGAGFAVQLASFRSQAEAETAWTSVRARHAQALGGREHLIERADIPGKGIYYRLRVGPMAAKNAAAALCSTLKAQGQDCYVSKL